MSIDVIILLGLNLSVVLVLFAGLWLIALRTRDPSFVDAFWAFGISLCALLSFLTGHADLAQKLVITALCLVWGLRLGLHLFLRWRLEGQDKRYANLIASVREKRGWGFAQTTALFIFLPQAVLDVPDSYSRKG